MAKKKTRDQLAEAFREGARPTGNDFADLFASVVNCEDDGIARPGEHDPLRITARDKNRSILDLADTDDSLAWRLGLAGGDGNPGLNLSDANGRSRLFIDRDTGNVGIGTSRPVAAVDVAGTVRGIPVVDFQKVAWSFKNQKGSAKEIPLTVTFPAAVLKAEAMLGSWRVEYERRERIQAIGIEITSLEVSGNTVALVVRCTLKDASRFFDDYYHGSGDVVVIATLDQAIHDDAATPAAGGKTGAEE